MSNVLTEIINILISGLSSYAQGFGSALSTAVQAIFLQTTGTGSDAVTTLSTAGGIIVVFAGLSLAIGLTKLVFNWIVTLGGRK